MRCVKLCGVSFLLAIVLPAWAAEPVSCLQTGKKLFEDKQYTQAKDMFQQCVKNAPNDTDARLSLAGALLTLDQLDEAEQEFQTALQSMNRTSPYLSYTYSMLGDISLKQRKNDSAFDWYTKSLESNAANVNSLIGKGVITEYRGDRKAAAEFYRSALAVEPLNLVARQRLISLEPAYFTDKEMLLALKQRHVIQPEDNPELTPALRQQFLQIHQAEMRRGVDYLKRKYPKVPANYISTLNKGTDFEREILTLNGYQALQKHIGQDAVEAFVKIGVPQTEVYELRDLKGRKIFNKDNTLTEHGFLVYTEALQNHKLFLRPKESIPPTQAKLEKIARIEEDLKQAGYMEISRKELKFVETQTRCSEQTLRNELGLYVLPVTKQKRRYFIIARQTPDPKKSIPYYYLMKEKARHDPTIKVPSNTLAESYAYYDYTICLSDGNLVQ